MPTPLPWNKATSIGPPPAFNQNGTVGMGTSPLQSLGDLRVGGRRLEDLLGEILHTNAPGVPQRMRVTSGDADAINLHGDSQTGSWNRTATDRSVPLTASPKDLGDLIDKGVLLRQGESAASDVPSLVTKLLQILGEK